MTHEEAFRMTAKNDALKRAADQFKFYAGNHRSKNPPDEEKARVNDDMAQMCEYAKRL